MANVLCAFGKVINNICWINPESRNILAHGINGYTIINDERVKEISSDLLNDLKENNINAYINYSFINN